MRKDTQLTRKKILDAAERLFGEKGIAGTSLLDVVKAAEQKNRSALQYHFTNKDGLLDAVLDRHAQVVLERRNQLLDELEAKGDYELLDLMYALVKPMAERIDEPGGAHFLRIHSELMSHEQFREFRETRYTQLDDVQRLIAMSAPLLPSLAPEEQASRNILTGCLLVHGLTTYLASHPQPDRTVFVKNLSQTLADLLSRP